MNIKLILFSGIITAVIGAVFGLSAGEISKGEFSQIGYKSQSYHVLYNKYYVLIGAGLGFAIGAGQQCLRELKDKEEKEIADWRNYN